MPSLRELVARAKTIVAPGAADALSAKLIEAHGFECVYIGSYATAASRFALPDTGLLTLDALVEQARTIVQAVKIPVIADAEGGFHDTSDLWRTVQAFERAGVAAIHIEDHTGAGKHTSEPQQLRSIDDTAARIRAAVAARQNRHFIIVARSDGADMVFPTAVGPAELAEVRKRIAKPAMIIDMPGRTIEEHHGAAIVLYYAFSTLVEYHALSKALADFHTGWRPAGQEALEEFLGYGKGRGSSEDGR